MVMASLGGRSRILSVPYFIQPTGITCQSTCLRMMAAYLEQEVVLQSTGAAAKDIQTIWKDVNEAPDRPSKVRNAHANLKWWLERHFPRLRFEYVTTTDEAAALERIVRCIDSRLPVLMSVSHARVAGHIVLVVGYEGYQPGLSTADFNLVVHDPYGRFDPSLLSNAYGKRRTEGAMSLVSGGETGPGKDCRVPVTAASRQRAGDSRRGTYYLLYGAR